MSNPGGSGGSLFGGETESVRDPGGSLFETAWSRRRQQSHAVAKPLPPETDFRVSEDGTEAQWGNRSFRFTPTQAEIVLVLWRAYRSGEGSLRLSEILVRTTMGESKTARMQIIFRIDKSKHPAIDTMITKEGFRWKLRPPA